MTGYGHVVYTEHPVQLPPLTGAERREACINAPTTTPGPDGWSPDDRAVLGPGAFAMLAELLNAIEQASCKRRRHRWPALNFRVLTVLPLLYGRWAGCRLRLLASWVQRWKLDEIMGGLLGSGADEAWWGEAIF